MTLLTNKTFYPTPKPLIRKMLARVKGAPSRILEPQAGTGAIIDEMIRQNDFRPYSQRYPLESIAAIEIDPELQATLRGKKIKVIDSDFLEYTGPDKFDLIIGNPPFDTGDKHLLKAIDIMYRGEIVYLLNSETIKNPHTNTRAALVKKLGELGAKIEYIQHAFKDADRPTGVEVALIYINIQRNVDDDLFAGCQDPLYPHGERAGVRGGPDIGEPRELSTGRTIEELVAEYNQVIQIGQATILGYFRNFRKIGKYIGLNKAADAHDDGDSDMTAQMQSHVNALCTAVRIDFWRRTLDLPEVVSRLTTKKREEFEHQLRQHCDMDFTTGNIRQFVLNLIGGYEKTLTAAVLDIFDMFTIRHAYHEELHTDNIHYFNGWKTNKAYKVNRRIVIPVRTGYGHPFISWNGWRLDHDAARILNDIDLVCSYFDGLPKYQPMSKAIEAAFAEGRSTRIESTYFTVTCYKKGTAHLTFKDADILRRFNVVACKEKQWLPHDYGKKAYADMPYEEQSVVSAFEGERSYTKNLNRPLFAPRVNQLKLTS